MRPRWIYPLVAVVAGLLSWWLVDWTAYNTDLVVVTGSHFGYEPAFKLSFAEQLVGSAVIGVSLAALLFAGAWLKQASPPGRSILDKVAIAVAIGGAVMGWGLVYLGLRWPSEMFGPHYSLLGIDTFLADTFGLLLLMLSEATALGLGIIARARPWGKAAMVLPVLVVAPLGGLYLAGFLPHL